MKTKWVIGGIAAGFALYAVISSWPEIVRYRRMMSM